jgi:DNA-binding Lrp family transcriptional regulator
MWSDALGEAGVAVTPIDADHVELRSSAGRARYVVRRLGHAPPPSKISHPPKPRALLAVPKITRQGLDAATRAGWSVVTDDGTVAIRFPRDRWVRRNTNDDALRAAISGKRGPDPWGSLTVVRRLLEKAPAKQADLAKMSSINQSRVSQILKPLTSRGLVRRTTAGWEPSDWARLCDWWLATYRGPGGVATHWYSLDDAPTQAVKAVESLSEHGRVGVSGDVAADLIAPWRRPVQAVVYAEQATDLSRNGWTATDSDTATLIVVNPKDPGVWPVEPLAGEHVNTVVPLVDPLQVLWDLTLAPGPDAPEAAARWRDLLRAGSRRIGA